MYNYKMAVTDDCKDYIREHIDSIKGLSVDDAFDALYDDAFVDDPITGNASGSYTFNSYKAGENLVGNFELLKEALEEFGGSIEDISKGEEFCDVTIRCYLLSECLHDALEELEDEFAEED